MSWKHALIDSALWFIALVWVCELLAKHPGPALRSRRKRLVAPSPHCERTGDWTKVTQIALTRRQAD